MRESEVMIRMDANVWRRAIWRTSLLLLAFVPLWAAQKHAVRGLVLRVDPAHQTMVVSCEEIPGYMDAMVMPFIVHDANALQKLQPGTNIDFDLVVDKNVSSAENIRIHPFESLELDPTQARRLTLMEKTIAPGSLPSALSMGQSVPDFVLTDQSRNRVALSQLVGKVVAVTFIYTRCPLPDYCFRLSNNFSLLQKRFRSRMGSDLVLLSIVIDPTHDQPDALANYAHIWKADPKSWHFLTGPLPDIERVSREFDMNFYPDEALLVHSFHTVVINREGKLAANLEGNNFSAKQLGDLVETMLPQPNQRRGN
jgi:protein SCO1/2